MFQACRPAGRLFYLVLGVVVALSTKVAAGEETSAARLERPTSFPAAKPAAAKPMPRAASPTPQSGPTLTDVVDTVLRADGTEAQGVLVITWPAFVEANGAAVAGGALNVTLAANGALNVELAPNAGGNSSRRLLHGGVPTWTRSSANRVLAGADELAGDSGAGEDDTGERNGYAWGVCAICQHGDCLQGE
jgi:hypothetical protein